LEPERGICLLTERLEYTPELVLMNYCQGMFPIGKPDGSIEWDDPDPRGVLFLSKFHVPRRVREYARRGEFDIRLNAAFRDVVMACAERNKTWITPQVIDVYTELHRMGIAHSVEAWRGGALVGGGFGVSLGAMFSLESMFYRVNQSSKVALLTLVDRLKASGIEFMDVQYVTNHWTQFGAEPVKRNDYKKQLIRAIIAPVQFRAQMVSSLFVAFDVPLPI
jgi:leucyl/phenylalanyl-tRNA--protein transferase